MKSVTALGILLLASSPAWGADYVGAEKCASCHEEQAKTYAAAMHGKAAHPDSPAAAKGCETCHGPGSEHVTQAENGETSPKGIRVFKAGISKDMPEQNQVCLSCHTSGARAHWKGSAHEARGLACVSCHSVHGGHPHNLVAENPTDVCLQCHKKQRAEMHKFSRHPILEGKVTCADCHDPHGSVTDRLVSAPSINEKCFQCHAEKRGPFLWEHTPATEDCTTCHVPHGSTHEKLLKTKVPGLCQRCHSISRHPGTLYTKNPSQVDQETYTALGNRVFYKSCRNCHSQIHGSNNPSGKILDR